MPHSHFYNLLFSVFTVLEDEEQSISASKEAIGSVIVTNSGLG